MAEHTGWRAGTRILFRLERRSLMEVVEYCHND
jgi:hypothetical protein